ANANRSPTSPVSRAIDLDQMSESQIAHFPRGNAPERMAWIVGPRSRRRAMRRRLGQHPTARPRRDESAQCARADRRAGLDRPKITIGETGMREDHFDRRTVLAATTALGAAALMPSRASAQGAAPAAGTLPARGEFVVRGAHVLTMDRD